jgi:DNA invertase Pin-like site-specific DNA recombinase
MPLKVALAETEARPNYQEVARKALHFRELGSSYRAIARKLDVDDKTVAKAIRWLQMIRS